MSIPQYERHPFLLSVEDVVKQLGTDTENGLNEAKAKELHGQYGDNTLDVGGTTPWYSILARQFFNAMIIVSLQTASFGCCYICVVCLFLTQIDVQVLFLATVLSLVFRDWIEGGVLVAVIVLNVSIGFVQELKAEKSMDALRALSSPSARVIRDGESRVIPK